MITFDEYYKKNRNRISASGYTKSVARTMWYDNIDKVEKILSESVNGTDSFSGNNVFWRLDEPNPDIIKNGYYYMDIRKDYEHCINNPYNKPQNTYRVSKYKMEKKKGRYLKYDHTPGGVKETVHHKNTNTLDDRLSNLELFRGVHPSGGRDEDLKKLGL